jgi:hypothetical protein
MRTANEEPSNHPALATVLDAIAGWVRKYRYAAELRDEMERCGSAEVARVAHDLGVSADDLVSLARKGPGAAELLPRLLAALGVDPDALRRQDLATMRDLQRLCIHCSQKSQCQHELAAGTAAQSYHEFCPNAYTLDFLLRPKEPPAAGSR